MYHIEVKGTDDYDNWIKEYLNTVLNKSAHFFCNNTDFYLYNDSKSTIQSGYNSANRERR